MAHYYYQKYPYLHYTYLDTDGLYTMFSIPPEMLAAEFLKTFNRPPKTFFDCGAATGEIVLRAQRYGMKARGIDIKKYPYQRHELEELFQSGLFKRAKVQIKSILDCRPIKSDIVYCNGILTYFTVDELPQVLDKFKKSKMLCAIHNTAEDVAAASKKGYKLSTCNEPRLIMPNDWWLETFDKNGFAPKYNEFLRCFCAVPKQSR